MNNKKQNHGKVEDIKKCPECGSKEIEKEKEETYCKKCGFVID